MDRIISLIIVFSSLVMSLLISAIRRRSDSYKAVVVLVEVVVRSVVGVVRYGISSSSSGSGSNSSSSGKIVRYSNSKIK